MEIKPHPWHNFRLPRTAAAAAVIPLVYYTSSLHPRRTLASSSLNPLPCDRLLTLALVFTPPPSPRPPSPQLRRNRAPPSPALVRRLPPRLPIVCSSIYVVLHRLLVDQPRVYTKYNISSTTRSILRIELCSSSWVEFFLQIRTAINNRPRFFF